MPGSFYDGRGQEATAVGATFALAAADPVCPLIRDIGAHLVKGTPAAAILGHYLGRAGGRLPAAATATSTSATAARGIVGMVSMLPEMMPSPSAWRGPSAARRAALRAQLLRRRRDLGRRLARDDEPGRACGSAPSIFVLEHNGYAYLTPSALQFAVDPLERAAVYGMAAVDGRRQRRRGCLRRRRARRASARRDGGGPTLIEAQTMRMHGHGAHDDASYVPAEELELWASARPARAPAGAPARARRGRRRGRGGGSRPRSTRAAAGGAGDAAPPIRRAR